MEGFRYGALALVDWKSQESWTCTPVFLPLRCSMWEEEGGAGGGLAYAWRLGFGGSFRFSCSC